MRDQLKKVNEGECAISRLNRFEPELMAGVDVIWRLILAFYDPDFSFGAFLQRFPEQRSALINCLVGDVLDKDLSAFKEALAQMTVPPQSGLLSLALTPRSF